jgi:hypothetical protein
MATESNKPILSGAFTVEELANLLNTMSNSNRESMKEFAAELASRITHPDPTPDELKKRQEALTERIESAREQEAHKADKRRHCQYPANPHMPHRRSGANWGMFNGSSVVAWQFIRLTSKDPETGRSRESNPYPVGVCMWCQTEFSPSTPDYEEALSWGLNAASGEAPMNVRTGNWLQ